MDPAARRTAARRSARNLVRALDALDEAVWVINSDHELLFLSEAAAVWLQATAEELVGRKCHVAVERKTRADEIAAALVPPLGLQPGGAVTAEVQPPEVAARTVRFTRLGQQGSNQLILAISGAREQPPADEGLQLAKDVRARLQQWRRQHAAVGLVAAAGASPQAVRLRQQMQLAAATRQHLSIIGPRGCGGEAVARRIHAALPPAALPQAASSDPLITVDTPLMDAELLEATLSPGAAHLGGDTQRTLTLVLRGVDESPLDVQQRLFEFATQHGTAVRLIGLLTGRPSQQQEPAVLAPALGLALSVLEVEIAPLASRPEDIALVAAALVDQRHAAGGTTAQRISREALDRLLLYPWPNNFEELEAAIRHAASACRGEVIEPADLPLAVRSFRLHPKKSARRVVETTLDDALQRFELEKIAEALDIAGGNRSEAALLLGISRGRLIRRLDGHGAAEELLP